VNWSGKCEGPGGGDRQGALCIGFTLVKVVLFMSFFHFLLHLQKKKFSMF
jgi:hypothetical protein